jgi:cyanuric acid amidohydrolase
MLKSLLEKRTLIAEEIIAVIGKTEGNGGVNDFTREYASRSVAQTLAPYLACSAETVEQKVALVMSGGTEGVLSPHMTVFTRRMETSEEMEDKRLAIGIARTREFQPEEIGGVAQIEETAKAVRVAMVDAGIDDVADVHFVQIKCPLLTADRTEQAIARGHKPMTEDSYGSMAYSRGASALGVATALGELNEPASELKVLGDLTRYSQVASTSAGIELDHNVIVVMGNARSAVGDYVIGHALMQDAIDLEGVVQAFASVGLNVHDGLANIADRIVNVFAKAEPSPDGRIRGYRHTMLDDSDITPTRHARAAVGGLLSGIAGNGAIYVSGGAEHQGPPGGGPIAVIARR